MPKRYVLFQAYGNEGILLECKFALMQLLKYNDTGSFCLVLYTDNNTFFKPILQQFTHYEIVQMNQEIIKQWRGEIDFVHRVKIEMLIHFFETHSGAVLYFDTDTYCKSSITPIFDDIKNGSIFMHTYEGNLNDKKGIVFKKWNHFLRETGLSYNGSPITTQDEIQMWNAGVLGFNEKYLPQLKDVLKFTDSIYPIFSKHTVEQFAFSYIFQLTTRVKATDKIIYHYWGLKEYRKLLICFFNGNHSLPLMQQLQQLQLVMPEVLFNDKVQHKRQPFLKKIFSKKWKIESYYPGK